MLLTKGSQNTSCDSLARGNLLTHCPHRSPGRAYQIPMKSASSVFSFVTMGCQAAKSINTGDYPESSAAASVRMMSTLHLDRPTWPSLLLLPSQATVPASPPPTHFPALWIIAAGSAGITAPFPVLLRLPLLVHMLSLTHRESLGCRIP